METKKYKVTLKPQGEIVEVEEGKNLLVALRECGTYVKSSCGGHATCSDCIIKIVSGEDYLTPPPFNELKLLGNVFHITKERLACQTCVTGDVTIDISKHDKARDEAKMQNKKVNFPKKKSSPFKVRKNSEVQEVRELKEKEREEEFKEKNQKNESWKNHWEKNPDGTPKKLAGGKRPKFFDTDKVNYDQPDYTRPLSAEKKQAKLEEKKNIEVSDKEFKKFRN